MRNISFQLTWDAFMAKQKDVTRRMGWDHLIIGERLQGIKQGMGLKKGEHIEKGHIIQVVCLGPEPLNAILRDYYGFTELKREGLGHMTPPEFVEFFCNSHKGCYPDTVINRIEYIFVD